VLEVWVYAAAARSLRSRNVLSRGRSDRLTTSAELEAAALVLRGELSALIEAQREAEAEAVQDGSPPSTGGSGAPPPTAAASSGGGVNASSRSQQLPTAAGANTARPVAAARPSAPPVEEEEDDESVEEEEDDVDEPSPPLENYSVRRLTWTVRGGARVSAPLVGSKVALGAVVGGRAQLLPFLELGIALSTALPIEITRTDPSVRISIWRSSLTAEALAVFPIGPRLRALIGMELGAVLYARSTDRVPEGYFPAGSEGAWSATLGGQGELQWLLTRQFGVALGLGLAYLPQRTRFAYTGVSSQPDEIAVLRSFEPHATASLFGVFGD
jgi:hypothetical protein